MLGHFLQFPQGGINMYLQKVNSSAKNWLTLEHTELLNSDLEQVYLFNALATHRKIH